MRSGLDAVPMNRRRMLSAIASGSALVPAMKLAADGEMPAAAQSRQSPVSLLLAHRISSVHWKTDRQFARLAACFEAHRRVTDDIALCDDGPPWQPVEQMERGADILKQRIQQLRTTGFRRVGINVGWTLGHWDVAGDLVKVPFQPMVGHDGRVSVSCPCPNSREFRAYIQQKYAILARTQPDFIWVDDDFRMSHHGVLYPCFCPICLRMFDRGMDRAALLGQLNDPAGTELRRAWTEFCAASLENLCTEIRQAVLDIRASIELGLMTIGYSHSTWAGYPITRWMKALGARCGRPGHGYYTDEVPRGLLNKAFDVGRQVRDYPPEVKIIEYELENYPHVALDKAARTLLNECTAALMMGCNGIAFFLFQSAQGTYEDYEPVLKAVSSERPAWEALLDGIAGLPLAGFWPADHRLLMANRAVDATGWFWERGLYDIQQPNQTAEMGLPLTTDPKAACGVLLSGKVAEAFTADELRGMLKQAVLLDSFALDVLWSRGLGELTGVRPGERLPAGTTERLTNHPLNGRFAGEGRQALAGPADGVCSLVPVGKDVGDLAHLIRHDGTDAGSCFSTYTNELGGRVAVSTHVPWRRLGRSATRQRLLAVADWLAGGRLPLLIDQTVRVAPLVRLNADSRVTAVLLNTALDPTGPLTVRLRARPQHVSLVSPGRPTALHVRRQGEETVVEVPSIPAWQTAILLGR